MLWKDKAVRCAWDGLWGDSVSIKTGYTVAIVIYRTVVQGLNEDSISGRGKGGRGKETLWMRVH